MPETERLNPITAFIASHGLGEPEYLADGVYMAHEGWQMWLFCERDGRMHSIALELRAALRVAEYAKEKIR